MVIHNALKVYMDHDHSLNFANIIIVWFVILEIWYIGYIFNIL